MILALVTGLIAGLFPALSASSSIDIAGTLKDGGRSNTAGRSQNRFRNVLVASEVALSLVLLLAAGLLIRSFGRLLATDLGLRTSGTAEQIFRREGASAAGFRPPVHGPDRAFQVDCANGRQGRDDATYFTSWHRHSAHVRLHRRCDPSLPPLCEAVCARLV